MQADKGSVLLIPAYRPGSALESVIAQVQAACDCIQTIVVVDDGSGPAYAALFERLKARDGVRVLHHAVNLGKGAALKTGLNYSLVQWPTIVGVVTADADGQHAPEDIVRVARQLSEKPECLVLGVRDFAGEVPLRSRLGNWVTRTVFRFFTGTRLRDTQTGLRGWPREYCEQCLKISINGYDFELECLLQLGTDRRKPLPVIQTPIGTVYLDGNASSHFDPVRDSMRVYFVFLRYCGASAVAAVLDSVTFFLVFRSTQNLLQSQVAGRCLAVTAAFILANKVVFRSGSDVIPSLAKYLALVLVMGFISFHFIRGLSVYAGVSVLAAKLIAEGILFLGNFAIQRDFVFARD